jgi:hypothetical protein
MHLPAMLTSPYSLVALMRAAPQGRRVSPHGLDGLRFPLSLSHPAISRRHTLHTLLALAPDSVLLYVAASAPSPNGLDAVRCSGSTRRAGRTEHVRWTALVEHMC